MKKFSIIKDGKKLCMHCKEMKSLEQFSVAKRGLGGVAAYCKPCFVIRYKSSPELSRKRTYAYRKRNREKWLSMHRIHQFRRRTQQKFLDDGTVTENFLIGLYKTENCFYCEKYIQPEKRTADHKIPLARNGWHSASNIVMACFSCNSSKSALTSEEYMEKINDHNCQNNL